MGNKAANTSRGLAAYELVMTAIGYGKQYLKRSGKLLLLADDLSLPQYVLHYLPLTTATYLLLNSGLSS